jgi:hypothetical protein
MVKDAVLSIRVAPALKEAIQILAGNERRSLSTYIEIALEEHVMRNGGSLDNPTQRRELPKPVRVRVGPRGAKRRV